MKKLIQLIVLSFVVSMQASATIINSEQVQTNPSSTDGLWAYSYFEPNYFINSQYTYYTNVTDFSGALFQGYVTGDNTNWPHLDAFLGDSGFQSSHIFETYIMSSVNQTVHLSSGGDDGHSIFIDDLFAVGAQFGTGINTTLDMLANESYKITLALANYGGGFHINGSISGETEQGDPWSGKFSNADNISMNATGDFDTGETIPEPATLALMGLGLAGIGYRRKNAK